MRMPRRAAPSSPSPTPSPASETAGPCSRSPRCSRRRLRFNELQDELGGIAPNVLSARLKALAENALVVARPYSDRPPRFVYELSDSGRELAGALRLLADWGARSAGAEPLRHTACGTALEARWWCPSCEETVDDLDAGDEVIHL